MLSLSSNSVAEVLHPALCSLSQWCCSVAWKVLCLLWLVSMPVCSMVASLKVMHMQVALMVQYLSSPSHKTQENVWHAEMF